MFYDDKGTLAGCTASAVEPTGESLDQLAEDIDAFKEALKLPVLTLADIPKHTSKKRNRDRSKNLTSDQVRASLGLVKPTSKRPNTQRKNGKKKVATRRSPQKTH